MEVLLALSKATSAPYLLPHYQAQWRACLSLHSIPRPATYISPFITYLTDSAPLTARHGRLRLRQAPYRCGCMPAMPSVSGPLHPHSMLLEIPPEGIRFMHALIKCSITYRRMTRRRLTDKMSSSSFLPLHPRSHKVARTATLATARALFPFLQPRLHLSALLV